MVAARTSAIERVRYDRVATGARLRQIRMRSAYTQAEVAWLSGITQAALSNYENGKRDIPIRSLMALADVLEVAPADFIPALGGSPRLPIE